jgi:DeoR/GlpR family transcriptional regulator of sugar metabolism
MNINEQFDFYRLGRHFLNVIALVVCNTVAFCVLLCYFLSVSQNFRGCMLASDRMHRVLELLKTRGTLRSSEIAKALNVSAMTVRRDLALLEEQGHIKRVHGGARVVHEPHLGYPLRENQNLAAKRAIGAYAATLVQDAEVIYLDAGTTTMELAKALKQRKFQDLRIVTHAVNIAAELTGLPNVIVVQIGGEIYRSNFSATGMLALEAIERFTFHRLFLGTQGLELKAGLSETNLLESEVKRAAIASSKWVALLTDSSKWNQVAFSHTAPLSRVQLLITDSRLPKEGKHQLKELGVEVVTVSA